MPVHLSRKLPPRGSLLTQRVGAPNGLDGVVGGSTANASVLPGHPLRRKTRKRHNFIHKDLDGTGSCWRGVVEMVGIQQVVGTRSMSKKTAQQTSYSIPVVLGRDTMVCSLRSLERDMPSGVSPDGSPFFFLALPSLFFPLHLL